MITCLLVIHKMNNENVLLKNSLLLQVYIADSDYINSIKPKLAYLPTAEEKIISYVTTPKVLHSRCICLLHGQTERSAHSKCQVAIFKYS